MRNIADTIKRLNARNTFADPSNTATNAVLNPLQDFGSNPGNLRAWLYLPGGLPADAPLVVVLHGCTQTAAEYDIGSGWSQLAKKHGFAVLYPEQQRSNNPNLCFNWFATADTTRGHGESLSISQMVSTMLRRHSLDRTRTFITGLSAGGAMTGAMLATYPELFKGGAIIAGLPYATATNIPEAFDRMRGHGLQKSEVLADLVRRASDYKGPWPSLSIWHGTADMTVDPMNMEAIIAQWHCLHAIERDPATTTVDGHTVRRWRNADGVAVIKAYSIRGMGHGTPIKATGRTSAGTARPFMLDVGISSTWHIAQSWELIRDDAVTQEVVPYAPAPQKPLVEENGSRSVGMVIEKALRAAGLMK
ncbi:alpha/beta hydrolase family esterase [Phyllobacterium zundukense]|uniref:PHB depolymerase family esterase n=1 Tax=Phyllobacterium zundukense TaxID=1867719 RepID=A0ACD4CZI6_9HYPH|nr:PHB depolymerase family esterase [Phyllobacterium zundukense]UXN59015.1 PHB depolymerase family esterase [Phyllobacterium zundukense]